MDEPGDEECELRAYACGLEERWSTRERERAANDVTRHESGQWHESLSRLDSSIKRNSAFVKRLRTGCLSSGSSDQVLQELVSLNMSKFVTEVTVALTDARIKVQEIALMLSISSHLHQRYPDFASAHLDAWSAVLPRKPADLTTVSLSKLRMDVRLFAHLISCGLISLNKGLPLLAQTLKLLTSSSHDYEQMCTYLPVVLSFCKSHAEEFLGVIPFSMSVIAAKHPDIVIPESGLVTKERQKVLLTMVQEYVSCLLSGIREQRRLMHKVSGKQGQMSVGDERGAAIDAASLTLNKVTTATQQLCDAIGVPFPDLLSPPPPHPASPHPAALPVDGSGSDLPAAENHVFEDDEERAFYTSLPDLKSLIPAPLNKDSQQGGSSRTTPSPDASASTNAEKEEKSEEKDVLNEDAENEEWMRSLLFVETDEDVDLVPEQKEEEEKTSKSEEKSDQQSSSSSGAKTSKKQEMDEWLQSLTTIVSREQVDKKALHFCTQLNTSVNRNKLIRGLVSVSRNRLDLLPFYARLAAQLAAVMPHVGQDLVTAVRHEFQFHVRKKDQMNLQSKVKTTRFMAELTKFGLVPRVHALNCLTLLLQDFVHHAISMACALVESCGRFLFRSAESHARCNLLLQQMMRKKALLPFDSPYVSAIDNAIASATNHLSHSISTRVQRPVMHQYIRKLLYIDLKKEKSVDRVCRQVRKLDWQDADTRSYLIKSMSAVHNLSFPSIACMADLLSALTEWQQDGVCRVVDAVVEDIKLQLEANDVRFNQRRIAAVHFLGQLYVFRLVDVDLVFTHLYLFISFGVQYAPDGESSDSVFSPLDPPDSVMRIRLVAQLLQSCGAYLSRRSEQVTCFLLFFQRYYWHKRSHSFFSPASTLTHSLTSVSFPRTVHNLFLESVTSLRPKFAFADNETQAIAALNLLLTELKNTALQLYPQLKEQQNSPPLPPDLSCIPEQEEEEGEETEETENTDDDSSEESEASSESSDESDSQSEDSAEQEDRLLTDQKKRVQSAEDQDFEKELERMVSESLASRTTDSVKGQSAVSQMTIPLDYEEKAVVATGLSRRGAKNVQSSSRSAPAAPAADSCDNGSSGTVRLTVMTRAGHKGQALFRALDVPADSELARELKQKEERIRREKEELKHLTLVMNERMHEEAETGAGTAQPAAASYLKQRKTQKGAPDADLIFGPANDPRS